MLQRLPRGRQGTVGLRVGAPIVLGTATILLSIVSLGLPGTVILAGGWLLALGLSRRVPGLDGPVCWAAAVIVEVAVLAVDTYALKNVSPHQHGTIPNLLALAGPAILGLLLAVPWPRRKESEGAPLRTPARPLIALTVTVAGLIVPMWIASHGVNYRIAWAMSGDARNHVLVARSLLENGGLSLRVLKIYPAIVDSITAMLAGAGHRNLPPGQLMVHDARALVSTYVLAGLGISLMTAAALLELVPPVVAAARRLPAATTVLVLSSAGVSVSALVLGTTLRDGFPSSYGTIPFVVAGIVAALRCCARPSPASFALIGPAGALTFLSFTTLAVVPLALVVAVSGLLLWTNRGTLRGGDLKERAKTRDGISWLVAIAISWGALLVCAGVSYGFQNTLHTQFLTPGSITAPQLRILWLIGFLAVAVAGAAPRGSARHQALVPLTAALVSGAMIKFLIWLTPNGVSWGYYPEKTLYLLAGCLLWIAFAPLLRAVSGAGPDAPTSRVEGALRTVQAAAAALVVYVLLAWSTSLTAPLTLASQGWSQPTAPVITEVARIADKGQPFLLWQWADPGNERLGEFWAALTWSYNPKYAPNVYPGLNGGVAYWAYFEQAQNKDVCTVARSVPGLLIVTHNPKLRSTFPNTCPASGAHVLYEK